MKKLLTLALMLVLVFALASCATLPEDIEATVNDVLGMLGIPPIEQQPEEHIHDFKVISSTKATCTKEGEEVVNCACGEEETRVIAALGHDLAVQSHTDPTCTDDGYDYYCCTRCKKESYLEYIDAYGHQYGASDEPSRFAFCEREGCQAAQTAFGSSGKYSETLTFNFTADHEAEITAKYEEVLALIEAAPEYDPTLHGYAESGALADEFASVDAIHTEFYELILYAIAQRQIAEIDYYCDMKNSELEERYSYMMDYYTNLIAEFYSLSQPFYDSCYRDFYYYGMTEAEINEYLFDSNTLSNPEYTALKNRNDELELEFLALTAPENSPRVNVIYAEYAANNNKMAKLMGYENYLEYAYENVYRRDYTYQDVDNITDYVSTHLSKVFTKYYSKYVTNYYRPLTGNNQEEYLSQVQYSFFKNMKSNTTVNDYIDKMSFTTNPEKQISFSDELNALCTDGNLYIGEYSGAFVTYLGAFEAPIAYFSSGYDTPFTVVHEFGHYMNEIYNKSEYSQSYDLLEMHSQGNEILYLASLKGQISDDAFNYVEDDQIFNFLANVMCGFAIDAFERAIYTDSYDGTYAEEIMADGTITSDEYDKLYQSINTDLGLDGILSDVYWKYGMTITSPCYYVSYSVSALSVLQLYEMAETDGFDAAAEAYLKLFTYTDVDPEYTDSQVLEYAGMYSATDEQLYIALANFFLN